MKKQMKALALMLGMIFSFAAIAQEEQQMDLPGDKQAKEQKIGHINADKLLQMMPQTKDAQAKIEAYRDQLEKDLSEMEQELQSKIKTFRENEKMMTNLSRETKTKEIQELQLRIQEYSTRAQDDLQNKQMELLSPIFDKASKAVSKVAKEHGFTYILDSSESKAVVIFADNGIDIMPLVKKELGLVE